MTDTRDRAGSSRRQTDEAFGRSAADAGSEPAAATADGRSVAGRRWWRGMIALAIAGGVVWYLHLLRNHHPSMVPTLPCVFRQVTGYDCPGCGLTRAVHHLLNGEWATAFRRNPLGLVILPLLGLLILGDLIAGYRGSTPLSARLHPRTIIGLAAVLTAWWWMRNLEPLATWCAAG